MLGYLKGYERESVLAPLFKMLEATFDLFVPLVMADIVNVGIAAHDLHYILVRCGLLLLLAFIGLTCSLTAQYFSAKAAVGYSTALRHALFAHIQSLSFSEMDTLGTSTLITRMTSDINQVQSGLNLFLRLFLRSPFVVLGAMVMAFTVNARAAMIFVVTIPLLSVVVFGVMVITRPLYKTVQTRLDRVLGLTRENLTGVRVVRAFGRENFERERFERQNQEYTTLWVRLCKTLSDFWAVGDTTACIQTMLVVVIGSLLCVRGEMTEGDFVSFAIYNAMVIGPVRRLGRVISEMSKAGVSVARIGEILDAPVEQDAADAQESPMDGNIVFDHVTFRYETGPDVLHDVSFTIPAGSSFGVLGGTGSGKSSLLLMLCKLYAPSEGRVTVGGVDLARMPAAWVREHVGVVLQEPFLFSRTIAENIGVCGADEAAIREAAKTACIADDIEGFANGYATMVGERGVTLSGGQKQRVAIARMLTRKTPVTVFDDSLSAVDTQTDEKIRAALARERKGATSIIISHRITTLLDCDNILVLDHGKVLQLGTPAELLREEGLFRQIYDMQMAIGEEAET